MPSLQQDFFPLSQLDLPVTCNGQTSTFQVTLECSVLRDRWRARIEGFEVTATSMDKALIDLKVLVQAVSHGLTYNLFGVL